jgi:hypothetical protein
MRVNQGFLVVYYYLSGATERVSGAAYCSVMFEKQSLEPKTG